MDGDACVEDKSGGDVVVDQVKKEPAASAPHRYTKEELLDIKELPISNERPECLSEKYDSDGVWDPEKWHASLYPTSGRNSPMEGVPLKRRIPDPRERLKEDDLDVVLSPQRRSFGGGCQGNAAPALHSSRPISPLENKENETLRLCGTRRIGSGRIIAARAFEREVRLEKERERDIRDFKDKRVRRDFGDKRIFSERRRNDSYAEEEPEWFSGGPTSQSETIELIGFDDKILEDDRRKSRRSRRKPESVKEECNGQPEETNVNLRSSTDQEVPHPDVLPEQSTGDFDFNEFFNLEKTMPGLASMIEDVLGEGPVTASRFSQWFSSNLSPSGSRSSSMRSTPHEELEKLAGFEAHGTTSGQGAAPFFTPIQPSECKEKVDILELLQKANVDLKPLLSTLSLNKARLRENNNSGAVLSLEEVEGGMKGMKLNAEPQVQKTVPPQRGNGTPFMAEHLEEALTGGPSARPRSRDTDMSAFNKLVSTMKASGTLPTQPKTNNSSNRPSDQSIVPLTEVPMPLQQPKNIFQELLGGPARSRSPVLLGNLLGNSEVSVAPNSLHGLHKGPSPPLFPQRAISPDYFNSHLQHSAGFPVVAQPMMPEQYADIHRSMSPAAAAQHQMRTLAKPVNHADLEALAFQQDLALHAHQQFQSGYNRLPQDKSFRNRPQRVNRSPGPQPAGRNSPGSAVTSMLSPSFTPTSVIRKMYATKEKSKDDPSSRPETKEEGVLHSQDESNSSSLHLEAVEGNGTQSGSIKTSSQTLLSKDQERLRPHSTGQHTPTTAPTSTFPRSIYPVPLMSHVPMVRPPPHLHPNVVQRMLTQGIQPQQLGPALVQAGIYPPHVDLAQLQGLPPAILGQTLYPLNATGGHPLLPPRANSHMQLAVMQQQLQQQRQIHPGPQSQNQGPHRSNGPQRHDRSPPPGLAKWFGADVLDQQLPSMPAKVISVDELEFRP
ncbi:eukaryotic translation initiation factor 4E transporter [Corythoichthys intestinalis]|uniref:eukaryotic translation initiation factor 4E transporter n=1 Tax=Corythoichthys intestinalis TaxID=161448 RepID=UPI0025A5BFDB|nr:eukaryotic translation initiation factor 4E transporter [Corythoichthys intestinalis]XP_057702714.1 eukaryotic translation initiation factor 4E transporter [Corythoichthys intestinalis]XP_057702715.1 eukaryotic translation initiation factor 4E transporter [Corythoichthys intestinalis]XP_057702716.1 eukaryotic translation initiation factor 4E transporter [Corythoichthys intestinalis]XP_057702717.1 eukaryotic translation initiation factor 4E transporter [Corythoichthys intestinalis]XP_0577027